MKPKLIDDQEDLDYFITSFKPHDLIALDTEFVRRNTYYAKLSLLQIAIDSNIYIFDALKLNLKPLWYKILETEPTIIIHSGRQDLEIFFRLYGILPKHLFDTQIAAQYCGFRSSVSYGELCSKICNIELDKTHQSGDWLERKLPPSKIKYAAMDVAHLKDIYLHLMYIIDKKSLHDVIDTATRRELLDPSIYENKFAIAWKKVKFQNKRRSFVKRMILLAAFRERSASELDIPRRFFLTDSQLSQICTILPQDDKSLRRIRYLRKWVLIPEYRAKLYEICKEIADTKELVKV